MWCNLTTVYFFQFEDTIHVKTYQILHGAKLYRHQFDMFAPDITIYWTKIDDQIGVYFYLGQVDQMDEGLLLDLCRIWYVSTGILY